MLSNGRDTELIIPTEPIDKLSFFLSDKKLWLNVLLLVELQEPASLITYLFTGAAQSSIVHKLVALDATSEGKCQDKLLMQTHFLIN